MFGGFWLLLAVVFDVCLLVCSSFDVLCLLFDYAQVLFRLLLIGWFYVGLYFIVVWLFCVICAGIVFRVRCVCGFAR